MRCIRCNYDLNHHRANRCPECGNAFDPLLSETYKPDSVCWRRYLPDPWMVGVALCLVFATLYVQIAPIIAVAKSDAGKPSALYRLQTTRSQLDFFAHQHERPVTLAELQNNWEVLVTPQIRPDDTTLGPYMQQPPKNWFNCRVSVVAPGNATVQDGWVYDEDSGKLWMICDKQTAERESLDTTNDFIVIE